MPRRAPGSRSRGGGHGDVVVVGGGNAGFCAAHAARAAGARVLVLEKGTPETAGGNSYYTAGAFRFPHGGLEELRPLLEPGTVDGRLATTAVPPYPEADFRADLDRTTGGRADAELADVLVTQANAAVRWLAGQGVGWRLMYERQAYQGADGRLVFFGGLALGTVGGGKGLMASHTARARATGVEVRHGATVDGLLRGAGGVVRGVRYVDREGDRREVPASAVVLAAGGFEADPERRRRHLGPGWERALVRGSPLNTGEVLDLAVAAGAARHGDWSSCHSVAWDAGADPAGGNRHLTNQLTRQSYPLGIVVNRDGRRFLDEGADFRNYTYARYGREILGQPGGVAFQVFDAKTRPLLRTEEYDAQPVTGAEAPDLERLAELLGIDPRGLRETVDRFNASIVDVPFDPTVRDGRAARVEPPKSNWSLALDTPPYSGFAVACGITFTFGGVHVDRRARVLREDGAPLGGLLAAGEMVGGLFAGNYPGGSGLTAGTVFGRLAGTEAARGAARP